MTVRPAAHEDFALRLRKTRSMDITDEERSIILHWRQIGKRGQLIVGKINGQLDNCEVKTQHVRGSFIGISDSPLDNGDRHD